MKEGDILALNQLVSALEESSNQLEKAYNEKNSEAFNKIKGNLVQMQKKILNMTK